MATPFRSGTLGLIQHLFDQGTCTGLSDARLLERFVTQRDEAAFAALVARHGALVLNTCRAVLKDPNAADDAFQATFVLLFRKAGSIRGRDALGAWLHRVAYRTAVQAQSTAARRRDVEKAAGLLRTAQTRPSDDSAAVLHEEIERLPDRFRRPVVLCDLEGMTREQAADYLECTEGSVRGRLAKGRKLLQRRLTRRGVTLAVPLVAPAGLPERLVATTLRAAAGDASDSVATFVQAASRGWLLARSLVAGVVLLTLGTAAALLAAGFRAPQASQFIAAPKVTSGAVLPTLPTTTVEGRVLDLEGRPIAGATIHVTDIQSPPNGDLGAWIDDVKRLGKPPIDGRMRAFLPSKPVNAMPGPSPRRPGPPQARPQPATKPGNAIAGPIPFPSATTDADGRFRLAGLPRDAIALASISGAGIETVQVHILTRDMPTVRVKDPMIPLGLMNVYYGAKFDHVVAPTRPIVGTVRDQDSGAPIPGVYITGMPNIPHSMVPTRGVEATTDADSRYQINGLPASRGFRLFTQAPAGQPYVNGGFVAPAIEPKPGPIIFNITLKRGVLVRGRVTDKVTGKSLRCAVSYFAFSDNPFLVKFPNFNQWSQETRVFTQGPDDRFTIPALPGRGLIAARVQVPSDYLAGVGAESIKGFDPRMRAFHTFPSYYFRGNSQALVEINLAPGTQEVTLELQADPGRKVTGTMIGPDGQPILGGVEIRTLEFFQPLDPTSRNSSTFVVKGLPAGPNRLDFFHAGRKLAGSLRLKGDETGGLTVKLQPWGAVVGRVVDDAGKPRNDVEISSSIPQRPDLERGTLRGKLTVDKDGRFRIEGLVPGVKYHAQGHVVPVELDAQGRFVNKPHGPILEGVQVGPGETKDLGDTNLPAWKGKKEGN